MEQGEIIPSEREVKVWLFVSLKHSVHMEYFLYNSHFPTSSLERPHDLVGLGNKYEWPVIKGLALQFRNPKVDFDKCILPSLKLHRQQYHHLMWNNSNENNSEKPLPAATEEDMYLGAFDTICSWLENRPYNGGSHSYDEIEKVLSKNSPERVHWISAVISEMRTLRQPDLERIISLTDFPNMGLPKQIYDSIVERTRETVGLLKNEKGYFL
jgi:hypothetical protein